MLVQMSGDIILETTIYKWLFGVPGISYYIKMVIFSCHVCFRGGTWRMGSQDGLVSGEWIGPPMFLSHEVRP